jgi:hypothetical protein
VRGESTNWQMGVAAAPEMSRRTCSGPTPPTAARGIHAAHLAAAPFLSPEDDDVEGAAGVAGLEAEHTSRARRALLLPALGFAGRWSQLGLVLVLAAGSAREWKGRSWTAAIGGSLHRRARAAGAGRRSFFAWET